VEVNPDMTSYSIALFVHIVGALLLVALLTVEGVTLRTGATAARLNRVLGPVTLVAILVPGFYMAAQIGWQPWTAVGLVSYVLIAAAGTYTGISVMRGGMSAAAATISWLARTGLALGVVFDMTVKPDAIGSVAAVVIGVALAIAAAVPTVRLVRAA
jgi:hypothetical protein